MLTAAWGGVAISFALFANLVENLIQAINILGSIFYGSILGIFLVAFFLRFVRGSAVFVAALTSQALVLILFYTTNIGYLWYNVARLRRGSSPFPPCLRRRSSATRAVA